jgi:glycogen debranching enzyme
VTAVPALEGEAAAPAAERLVQPDALTGGLRTLSSDHPAFRPHAYHRGGV